MEQAAQESSVRGFDHGPPSTSTPGDLRTAPDFVRPPASLDDYFRQEAERIDRRAPERRREARRARGRRRSPGSRLFGLLAPRHLRFWTDEAAERAARRGSGLKLPSLACPACGEALFWYQRRPGWLWKDPAPDHGGDGLSCRGCSSLFRLKSTTRRAAWFVGGGGILLVAGWALLWPDHLAGGRAGGLSLFLLPVALGWLVRDLGLHAVSVSPRTEAHGR